MGIKTINNFESNNYMPTWGGVAVALAASSAMKDGRSKSFKDKRIFYTDYQRRKDRVERGEKDSCCCSDDGLLISFVVYEMLSNALVCLIMVLLLKEKYTLMKNCQK